MTVPFFMWGKSHECMECKEKFRYRANLDKHYRLIHKTSIYKYNKVKKGDNVGDIDTQNG